MTDLVAIPVAVPGHPYDIHVGPDALDAVGSLVEPPARAEAVAVISDANVAALHGERLIEALKPWNLRVEQLTLAPGEASKSPAILTAVWRWMTAANIHRGDLVLAFGGGVVGDLAGFAAATFHRGVEVVQVPTTLLAQVDASIGGKTAVDLPEGKNLVGAFHQPRAVIADTSLLGTLGEDDFATGMAEVIKHGLIADTSLLAMVREQADEITSRAPETIARMVAAAATVKAAVVAEDEREAGRRAHLNYGHTLGHALETLAGYEGLTHGRAVSIGMMFAAALGHALGHEDLRDEHRAVLDRYDLPTGGVKHDPAELLAVMGRDKKYDQGLHFVVLQHVGSPVVVADVPDDALATAFQAVRA